VDAIRPDRTVVQCRSV